MTTIDVTSAITVERFSESSSNDLLKKSSNAFIKHDINKPNLAILLDHPYAITTIAEALQYGANKYNRKNWKLCENLERYESACLRHITAYHNGEYIDKESGIPHLALAACSLLFLLELTNNTRS